MLVSSGRSARSIQPIVRPLSRFSWRKARDSVVGPPPLALRQSAPRVRSSISCRDVSAPFGMTVSCWISGLSTRGETIFRSGADDWRIGDLAVPEAGADAGLREGKGGRDRIDDR